MFIFKSCFNITAVLMRHYDNKLYPKTLKGIFNAANNFIIENIECVSDFNMSSKPSSKTISGDTIESEQHKIATN